MSFPTVTHRKTILALTIALVILTFSFSSWGAQAGRVLFGGKATDVAKTAFRATSSAVARSHSPCNDPLSDQADQDCFDPRKVNAKAVMGTQADDQLIVTATEAGTVSYSLNNGPAIRVPQLTNVSFVGEGGNDRITINGTDGNDQIVLSSAGSNNETEQVVINQTTPVSFAGFELVVVNAGKGSDQLTIINPAQGIYAPASGIEYNGGGNPGDALNMLGGGGAEFTETYFVGTTAPPIGSAAGNNGNGLLRFTGPQSLDIRFTGLAPIVDTVAAASLTINGTDAANTISITNGGVAPRLRVAVDAFEPIDFDNKTTVIVNGGDSVAGGDVADMININSSNVPAALTTLTINGNEGNDTINALGKSGAYLLNINGQADDDTLIGSAGNETFDGGAGNDTFIGNGGTDNIGAGVPNASGDTILVPDTAGGDTITLALSSGNLLVTINGVTTTYGNFIGGAIATSGIDLVSVNADAGADMVNINSTEATIPTAVNTGAGNDTIAFANGVSLNGGTVDGGADTDTLDYSAYATSVAVNLGLGSTGLSGSLDSMQEVPTNNSIATGTVTISNYNATARTFDINVTVTDLPPADVTGFHIHRAPVGTNGPVIVNLQPLAALVPAGTGFTFNATGVTLPVEHEAAFLGGITYVNVHTAVAPGGLIRGQVFSNGNVNLASGTATGTNSVTNVENAMGGSGADSLVGSFGINVLAGNPGNDTIVGGPGNDTMNGGDNNDVLVWSNGDNNDVLDGNLGTDVVQVNGSVTAGDVFTAGANGARIAVARTNLVPFALDIGTTEQLIVNGVGGDDTLTLNSLAGVADLAEIRLNGFAGNDTFNVPSTVSPIALNIQGHAGADRFVLATASNSTTTLNGGIGTDTLDYSALTTPVTVNLGLGSTGLSASLDGLQEVPPQTTTAAAGTATISNYNAATKTFDISVTVTDLDPAAVTGFHIHRAPVGTNGPVIVNLQPLAALVPSGTGFTFTAMGVTLPVEHEAAFLGGITYVNIHTAVAPGGLIRGQVFSNGNVNLASGTATGTNSIINIENVTGGSGNDSLLGSIAANLLQGNPGNDTIVGGPGADTFLGGDNNDVLVWSNGDGSDVMDGQLGNDVVQVNGSLTANDVFTIGANGTRVAFARVSPGPFTLDIGTTEILITNGIGGDDSMTLNSLAGVTDLTEVRLNGLAGNDTLDLMGFPVSPFVINILGGVHSTGDTLNVNGGGVAVADNGTMLTAPGSGTVNYAQIETKAFTNASALAINS
ncbi:MAG TPA: CHRD domain-containing protein, partial [Blastocatellia bacterium]|nr:CHRD domain-containing protein [Blastocatellia bacterium]